MSCDESNRSARGITVISVARCGQTLIAMVRTWQRNGGVDLSRVRTSMRLFDDLSFGSGYLAGFG